MALADALWPRLAERHLRYEPRAQSDSKGEIARDVRRHAFLSLLML